MEAPAKPQAVVCWSGGKDSALALHFVRRAAAVDVVGLVTTFTTGLDRVVMHGVRRELILRQAEAIGLPLTEVWITPGAANGEYESAMGAAFDQLRSVGVSQIVFGDIFLQDLRDYRDVMLKRHGLVGLYPLWQQPSLDLAIACPRLGIRAVLCCVDLQKLDRSTLGREIDSALLSDLPAGVDPCGENGEYHSFVYQTPDMANHISVELGESVERDGFAYIDLLPR